MKAAMTLCLALLLLAGSISIMCAPLKLYVSTEGNDSWNGKSPTYKSGINGPLQTPEAARDKLRKLKNGGLLKSGAIVYFRKGTYLLDRTLEFDWRDSASEANPVIYTAYPGEQVTIGGGRRITGWKPVSNGMWEAPLPDFNIKIKPVDMTGQIGAASSGPVSMLPFRELFVNGEPQIRSRYPNSDDWRTWPVTIKGYVHDDRHDPAKEIDVWYPEDSIIKNWPNVMDVEINILASWRWVNAVRPLRSVDESGRHAILQSPAAYHINKNDPFRVENVIDAIDEPGEWCVNTLAKTVTILPPTGVDMSKAEVIAPALEDLITVTGSNESSGLVSGLIFAGLTLSQAKNGVLMSNVQACRVENCRIIGLGGQAIDVKNFAQRNVFSGNVISMCGSSGISINGYPPGTKDVSYHNVIVNNEIFNCGRSQWNSPGISLGQSGLNIVSRNYVHDMPYVCITGGGMSIVYFNMYKAEKGKGFRWDEIGGDPLTRASVKKFLHCRYNLFSENVVQRYMNLLDDGGGIYLWCPGLGNTIRKNVVCETARQSGGLWIGLYMDDEVDGVLLEDNLVYRVGMLSINKGDNIWRNNDMYAVGTEPANVKERTDTAIKLTKIPLLVNGNIDSLYNTKTGMPIGVSNRLPKPKVVAYADTKPGKGGAYLTDKSQISSHAHGAVRVDSAYGWFDGIRLGDKRYRKGLVTHAMGSLDVEPNTHDAEVIYDLGSAKYKRFKTLIGLEPDAIVTGPPVGSVTFEVYVRSRSNEQWKSIFDSGIIKNGDTPRLVDLDITGATQIRLRATDAGDDQYGDAAVWACPIVE